MSDWADVEIKFLGLTVPNPLNSDFMIREQRDEKRMMQKWKSRTLFIAGVRVLVRTRTRPSAHVISK